MPLPRALKNKLFIMVCWLRQPEANNNNLPLSEDAYLNLTREQFDVFRIQFKSVDDPSSKNAPVPASPSQPAIDDPEINTKNAALRREIENFKKGLKGEAALHPSLREEKHWDSWNRSLHAQARAHDVADILDPKFVPTTKLEVEIFHQKQ